MSEGKRTLSNGILEQANRIQQVPKKWKVIYPWGTTRPWQGLEAWKSVKGHETPTQLPMMVEIVESSAEKFLEVSRYVG